MSSLLCELDAADHFYRSRLSYREATLAFNQKLGVDFTWDKPKKYLIQLVGRAVDELNSEYFKRNSLPCRKGCGTCCHQLVGCTKPEMDVIVEYISRQHPKIRQSILGNVQPRISDSSLFRQYAEDKGKIEELKNLHKGKPCMFLDEFGSCLIYEARPIVCRIWRSRQICEMKQELVRLVMDDISLQLVKKIDGFPFQLIPLPFLPLQ